MLLADFINTLPLWQWGLLALVPPAILALYFLKLRRQPLAVPSTYLWSKTIEDLHVNSLWQRLRQSLLLFLQLALILLLAFSLLRPGWKGTELAGKRSIFMLDTSASMAATDDGPSRLESAKKEVRNLIDQMKSGDVAMIISFSNSAKVEQPFTDSRNLLRSRLEGIQQTAHGSDLSEALRAAAGLANPGQTGSADNPEDLNPSEAMPATMYIHSDGGFASIPSFKLGNLEPKYIQIGKPDTGNVAIVAFSADRNPEKQGQLQAFARVENFGLKSVKTTATLLVDGQVRDAASLDIPGREGPGKDPGSRGLQFDLADLDRGKLELQLDLPDALLSDNKAYAIVSPARQAKVLLVTPGNNQALQLALETEEAQKVATITSMGPQQLEAADYQTKAEAGIWDLVIYDQCSPTKMPQCNTLFIGRLPPKEAGWSVAGDAAPPVVTDLDQVHPLTQMLTMSNVMIAESTPLKGPPGASMLIDSDIGWIYAVAPRQGFEDAVLGFEIVSEGKEGSVFNTDWSRRRSFPVFVLNAVRYLGGVQEGSSAATARPGIPRVLQAALPVPVLKVTSPAGQTFLAPREGENKYIFGQTDELGFYSVQEGTGDKVSQQFSVNLFDPRESDLTPREKLEIGHEEVLAQVGRRPARQELWKWLVLLAIGLLVAEWYIYNRRVYI